MHPPPVVFLLLPAIWVAKTVERWLQPEQRARRALARAQEKRLRDVADGDRVRVFGRAVRAKPDLTAPITGRKCIGYRFVVEDQRRGGGVVVARREECLPFDVAADGVQARVEGSLLFFPEIDARSEDDRRAFDEIRQAYAGLPIALRDRSGDERRLVYREAVLEDGDPIWIVGRASIAVDPSGERESPREPPIKRSFYGSKREPTVVADRHIPGEFRPPD